jgi:hypothetical protein
MYFLKKAFLNQSQVNQKKVIMRNWQDLVQGLVYRLVQSVEAHHGIWIRME